MRWAGPYLISRNLQNVFSRRQRAGTGGGTRGDLLATAAGFALISLVLLHAAEEHGVHESGS